MRSSKVAKRYARALMGLSNDHAQLEVWGAELERLARIVDSPEVAAQLESPTVSHEDRMAALGKIGERLDLSFPVRSFAVVVASHGRVREVAAMAESYARMLDDLMGRARATLTFAYQPTDEDLARVVSGLEAIAHKKIIPTTKVDASLMGGVIAELEGKIYDGSLASRLADAERRLSG
ncbi:MAG TPA: ATP synthase F1 subunit delta [Candidatus Binataceae bacterium]|nr:ATP synthase F1 subunit delta [Candidatus Binataceae bacterium]